MSVTELERLVIGGERVDAAEGATFAVVNPATGETIAEVAEGGPQDIDRAVAAARAAFPAWRAVMPRDRARLMRRFASLVEDNLERLALLETRNVGKPISDARGETQMVADTLNYYAGAVDKLFGETVPTQGNGLNLTFREPVGVVGLITPWNFPIAIASWKLGPALACGNTVVLKPATLTPLTALALGELALEAGIPEGVLNVVPGPGGAAGGRLVAHPDVNKIGFTGSTEVGSQVMRDAAATIKRVSLELGGKAAAIVFEDADLDKAAAQIPMSVFANAGQDCCARSRLLVQESVRERFLDAYVRATAAIRVGDPEDAATDVGPMITERQREISLSYIDAGREAGGTVLVGGEVRDGAGWYLTPCVIDGVTNDTRIAREEIFGPVQCVIGFKDEAEAVALANDTPYGLSASVWSGNPARALRVSRAVDAGVISVNSNSSVHVEAPFGGFKQSGLGRELGIHALEHYTELKNVFVSLDG